MPLRQEATFLRERAKRLREIARARRTVLSEQLRALARELDARVPVEATLKQAFSVMLQHDAGWVAVLDGNRYVGVLTPDSLHAALRRSVEHE